MRMEEVVCILYVKGLWRGWLNLSSSVCTWTMTSHGRSAPKQLVGKHSRVSTSSGSSGRAGLLRNCFFLATIYIICWFSMKHGRIKSLSSTVFFFKFYLTNIRKKKSCHSSHQWGQLKSFCFVRTFSSAPSIHFSLQRHSHIHTAYIRNLPNVTGPHSVNKY